MRIPVRFLSIMSFLTIFLSCKDGFDKTSYTPEEIGRYIAARLPEVIDPGDVVRIRFAVPVDTSQKTAIFSFNPDTKGNTWWEDELTLAFKPEKDWLPASEYQLQVNLDKAIKDVDPKMKRVVFDFRVRPVSFALLLNHWFRNLKVIMLAIYFVAAYFLLWLLKRKRLKISW